MADLVIGTAGYNTVTDILSFAKRAILIPRNLYREEQAIRARRMAELGWCSWLHPDEVTPAKLFAAIKEARQDEQEDQVQGQLTGRINGAPERTKDAD